ncbi:MAG TPA: formylglycine-generating enzyme family protein [Xanthomonadaceae bacterium]
MRELCGCLLLALAIVATGGCRGKSPQQPVAARTAPASAASDAAATTEPAAEPVAIRRPATEALPEPSPVPKKKIGEALRQAQQALAAGRIDERNLSAGLASQGSDASVASASFPSASGPDALALYRGVLATDAKNAQALQGIEAILVALHARVQAALARGDVVDAQRDVDRIALLRAGDPALPVLHDALDRGWRVAGLVERGRRLESVGALIEPRSANAAAAYRQALALAPGNAAAAAGLDRVQGVFIAQALAQADAAHYPQAEELIAQAAGVHVDSRVLRDARASLQAIRLRHASLLKAQADAALDAGDADRAARLLAQVERAAPRSPLAGQLKRRIANTRLYGRFLPAQVFSDPLSSSGRSPEMVVLPVGSFRMGAPDGEAGRDVDETPQRTIAFDHGFAIARTEITVEQFGRFARATHYRTDAERSGHSMVYDEAKGKLVARDGVTWRDDHLGRPAAPQQPVIHVSWNDAQAYTIWLSSQTAHLYRLPSEAEFEYALRAGGATPWPWRGSAPPKNVGNLAGSDVSPSGRRWGDAFAGYSDGYWGPAPVAHFAPDAFGLYDMVGNVSEWTQDCWHDSYRRAPETGSAWVNPGCARRVVRGASWASSPAQVRSAFRSSLDADESSSRLGFRVVREL